MLILSAVSTTLKALYVSTIFFSMIITAIPAFFCYRDKLRNRSSLLFIFSGIVSIIVNLSDALYAIVNGNPSQSSFNFFLNLVYLSMNPVLSYLWLMLVVETTKEKNNPLQVEDKIVYVIFAIPVIATMALSFIPNMTFYIDNLGYYNRGPLHIVVAIQGMVYAVLACAYAVVKSISTKSVYQKKINVVLACTISLPIIGVIIQLIDINIPSASIGGSLVFLLLYINEMRYRYSLDELTGLYQKMKLDDEYRTFKFKPKNNYFFLMIDLDHLKFINDTFGRQVGDKAILAIASSLQSFGEKELFPARIGGDEFAAIVTLDHAKKIDQIITDIRDKVEVHSSTLPISVPISIGYAPLVKDKERIEEVIEKVEKTVYQEKQSKNIVPKRRKEDIIKDPIQSK